MTTIIVLTSYVAHVFLCRWILKKAYQLNNNEYVKEFIIVSFVVFLGLLFTIVCFCVEYDEYRDKNGMKKTWFKGKNW